MSILSHLQIEYLEKLKSIFQSERCVDEENRRFISHFSFRLIGNFLSIHNGKQVIVRII